MALQVMRMLNRPYPEQERQFRRMVFNVIAGRKPLLFNACK
jgi:hypothetical protein